MANIVPMPLPPAEQLPPEVLQAEAAPLSSTDQTILNFANSLEQAQKANASAPLQNVAVPTPAAPAPVVQNPADQFVASPLQKPVEIPKSTVDSEMEQKTNETFDMQKKAANAIGDYQAKKLDAEANMREQLDAKLAERELKMQQTMQETNQRVDSELKTLDDYRQKISNFEFNEPTIEARGPFSGNAGQKIMVGIALALGGIGGALTGKGDNKALDIINQAIDRDMQTQKANAQLQMEQQNRKLSQLKSGADLSQNMLGALNTKFDNIAQAESATRALMLESAKNRLEGVAAKYSAPEVQAKAQILAAQLEQEQAKEIYKFKAAAEQKQILNTLGKKIAGGEGPQLNPAEMAMLPDDMRKAYSEQLERTVPGYGQATNKEAATEFRKYVSETGPAVTNAKQIYELGKKLSVGKSLSPKVRAEIESKLAILAGQLRLPITGPGALTDDEYKRLRETIGDPKAVMGLKTVELKKLDTVIKFLESSLHERAQQAGLRRSDVNKALEFKPAK